MRLHLTTSILLIGLLVSCKNENQVKPENKTSTVEQELTPKFQNKGHELVFNMVQNVGNYEKLSQLKDVVYTYTYQTPDGKTDSSTEKYIFDGELSYGAYHTHERTLANLEGVIEQGYDGNAYWLKHNGDVLTNEDYLKRVAFNRPTNFYWFTMFQKLLDPGLNYEFIEETTIDNKNYDVVKVSFDSENDKPTDIYQLYINKDTNLVDQFLFTVADFGKMETPNLMVLDYEEVDGLLMPTKRKYKLSTWNADVNDKPWIIVSWTNIKFNTNLTQDDFKK
ncbi:DUF6503 family protein [Winogradskyella thalassocola]|uniref:Uncharacterized protein n=1 Tax=Winogradskyella thalassocola TaxID=262004 RepID=A0A1G8JM25_9FLAO|nr:DUF6503 family protein [Winogradskyella thalassocola]SDI32093.1 hypothetical protein SAMN04489796_109118 [Winogradskyella thalassocola]